MIGLLIFYGLMVSLSMLFLKNSGIISLPMPDFLRETSDTIVGYLDSFEIPSKISEVKSQIALFQPALSTSTSESQISVPSDILTNLKDSVSAAIQQPPVLLPQQQEHIVSAGKSTLNDATSIALQQYQDKIHDTVIEPSSHFLNVWILTPLYPWLEPLSPYYHSFQSSVNQLGSEVSEWVDHEISPVILNYQKLSLEFYNHVFVDQIGGLYKEHLGDWVEDHVLENEKFQSTWSFVQECLSRDAVVLALCVIILRFALPRFIAPLLKSFVKDTHDLSVGMNQRFKDDKRDEQNLVQTETVYGKPDAISKDVGSTVELRANSSPSRTQETTTTTRAPDSGSNRTSKQDDRTVGQVSNGDGERLSGPGSTEESNKDPGSNRSTISTDFNLATKETLSPSPRSAKVTSCLPQFKHTSSPTTTTTAIFVNSTRTIPNEGNQFSSQKLNSSLSKSKNGETQSKFELSKKPSEASNYSNSSTVNSKKVLGNHCNNSNNSSDSKPPQHQRQQRVSRVDDSANRAFDSNYKSKIDSTDTIDESGHSRDTNSKSSDEKKPCGETGSFGWKPEKEEEEGLESVDEVKKMDEVEKEEEDVLSTKEDEFEIKKEDETKIKKEDEIVIKKEGELAEIKKEEEAVVKKETEVDDDAVESNNTAEVEIKKENEDEETPIDIKKSEEDQESSIDSKNNDVNSLEDETVAIEDENVKTNEEEPLAKKEEHEFQSFGFPAF
ncbi:unnamed protein product [Ambrosiozyma monospora]|uniref:Unnamed protein product n=1 Tax=Ambrosiozyma monospora TaxID=43982 RepID=A0A9W7DFR3_AMBMO|nr:unnamed protein product [Ambrosiozyma monospora]